MTEFRPFFLIPVYNHPTTIERVVRSCLVHEGDVLLVDDGSNAETKAAISAARGISPRVSCVTLPQNSGKGSAVLAGFAWAAEKGFTHAFQLDADAQQDASAIEGFLEASRKNPKHLICGYPIYNDSVPKARLWGRKLTNFWVAVNTLSFACRDALCGFRIYPMASTLAWLGTNPRLGRRMDFDADIVVQLYRFGVDFINLPVAIDYPPDGVSHFHAVENLRISCMHARNFMTMLPQIPNLIARHFR